MAGRKGLLVMVQHAERPVTNPATRPIADAAPKTAFTAFWLLQTNRGADTTAVVEQTLAAFATYEGTISLRAAYSTAGLSAGVDLILWVVAETADHFRRLAVDLQKSAFGRVFTFKHIYLGTASMSQYDPDHGPAFLKGIAPKRYLSVYPFVKTPDWYLLPFEERRHLMIEHGKLGNEFPSILTNTVNSFGIADQEFIVALEDDDPATLVKMVQRLRAAEVRKYTAVDTPIFLGEMLPLQDALEAAI
jgi:chlorite dismutase